MKNKMVKGEIMEIQQYLQKFDLVVTDNILPTSCSEKFTVKDKEGYKYFVSINNLKNLDRKRQKNKNSNLAKFYNGNIYTQDNIGLYLLNYKPNLTIIGAIAKKASEKSIFHCKTHNYDFQMSWNAIKNGQGCPACGVENRTKKKSHNIDWIKAEALRRFDITIISDYYETNNTRLKFFCNKHPYLLQEKSWAQMLLASHPCSQCTKIFLEEKYKDIPHNTVVLKTNKEFLRELYEVNGDRYSPLEEYKGATTKIKIRCNKCGREFFSQPNHLLEGHGCVCNKSLGENRIRLFLNKYKIEFEEQKTFIDCKDKRKLSYDFYLPKNNTLIEYQGIQHFVQSERFGGEQFFLIQKKHDEIKKKYALKHKYNFFEISYKNYDNINEILMDKLKDVF